jgi:hypothetical protein
MGMYSAFNYEDIQVTDWEGLKEYIELWNKADKDVTHDSGWNKWFKQITKKMLNHKDKTITFESWDNIKLISYWYTPYLVFLDGIAPYIEGQVHWEFENDDEAGYIIFEGGKCQINTGRMRWEEWEPIKALFSRGFASHRKELTPELKKFLMLSKMVRARKGK